MRIVVSEYSGKEDLSIFAEIDIPDSVTKTKTTMFRKNWTIKPIAEQSRAEIEAEKFELISLAFKDFAKQILFMENNQYRGWE